MISTSKFRKLYNMLYQANDGEFARILYVFWNLYRIHDSDQKIALWAVSGIIIRFGPRPFFADGK